MDFNPEINTNLLNIKEFTTFNLENFKYVPNSMYHDDGVLLAFLKLTKQSIQYIKHITCNHITREEEGEEALVRVHSSGYRRVLEQEILSTSIKLKLLNEHK